MGHIISRQIARSIKNDLEKEGIKTTKEDIIEILSKDEMKYTEEEMNNIKSFRGTHAENDFTINEKILKDKVKYYLKNNLKSVSKYCSCKTPKVSYTGFSTLFKICKNCGLEIK